VAPARCTIFTNGGEGQVLERFQTASRRSAPLWGSDWPHTPAHEQQTRNAIPVAYRPPRYKDVADAFLGALPSPALTEPIMAGNLARLYGFPGAG
jgi:predicted TIM-barrel fold metal-dependent hydrolase